MTCPDPERLAAYRLDRLPLPDREGLEAHAAACAPCREFLLCLGESDAPPARASWIRWAAAAVLLLAVPLAGWLAWGSREALPGPRPVGSAPQARGAFPLGLLTGACLTQGAEVLPEAGARVISDGYCLRAEGGNFWLEASGRTVGVDLPGVALSLTEGTVYVSIPPREPQAFLLHDALAGEAPRLRIWVLEGAAEVRLASQRERSLKLGAGQRLVLGPEEAVPEPAPPEEIQRLLEGRAQAATLIPGESLLPSGMALGPERPLASAARAVRGPYRWVTVLSKRDPATEVGVTLAVGGAWRQWALGLASRPPRTREIVEVVWDGERLKGRVNGRTIFSLNPEQAEDLLKPVPGGAWALSVWGGTVTMEKSLLGEVR